MSSPLRRGLAALAMLGALAGPAQAETLPGTALASAGCAGVQRVEVRLGSQVVAIPRPILRSVTGAALRAGDPGLGCPGRPAPAERVEVQGPDPKSTILLSPEVPADVAQKTIEYLRKMRGGPSCTPPERMICNVTETHGGKPIPFRYVFDPKSTQTMSDGAPANARCMLTGAKPFCLVDMNDPRGFHVTMPYPVEGFQPTQVMSMAGSVQAKLADVVGRKLPDSPEVAIARPPLLMSAAEGTTPLAPGWLDARSCSDDRVSLSLGPHTLALSRYDLLGITSAVAGPAAAELGCPGHPLPARKIMLRSDRIPSIVEIAPAAPADRSRLQAYLAELQAKDACRSGADYVACPWTDSRTGETVTTFLGSTTGTQRPSVDCRPMPNSPQPACSMTAYGEGLVARVVLAEPRSGRDITMNQLALGLTLAQVTGKPSARPPG